jgi:hypothetical protein
MSILKIEFVSIFQRERSHIIIYTGPTVRLIVKLNACDLYVGFFYVSFLEKSSDTHWLFEETSYKDKTHVEIFLSSFPRRVEKPWLERGTLHCSPCL